MTPREKRSGRFTMRTRKTLQAINDRLGKAILAYADGYDKKTLTDETAKQFE